MNKYLITGVAGSGKSSVCAELKRRGLAAYDTDAGFSYYADKKTGEQAVRPVNPTLEWYDQHERVFNEQVLNNLFKKHGGETLFICSITANQSKFYSQFDRIFLLTAPSPIVVDRLQNRTNNHFGKHPLELQRVIERCEQFNQELLAAGATEIDSTQSIDKVTDQILEQTK